MKESLTRRSARAHRATAQQLGHDAPVHEDQDKTQRPLRSAAAACPPPRLARAARLTHRAVDLALDTAGIHGYICIMAQMSNQKQPPGPSRADQPASPSAAAARPGPIDALLDTELFKALADPTRTLLLACVAKCGRACSVSEVAECCHVDFSVVSRHLGQLERAGLLESRRDGRSVRYSVRYAEVAGRLRDLANALDQCCPSGECGCGESCT